MAAAKYPVSNWMPEHPTGGTEIALAGLQGRLGAELDAIYLRCDDLGEVQWEVVRRAGAGLHTLRSLPAKTRPTDPPEESPLRVGSGHNGGWSRWPILKTIK
jgi:hypothetical protein